MTTYEPSLMKRCHLIFKIMITLIVGGGLVSIPAEMPAQIFGQIDPLVVPAVGISGSVINDEAYIFGGRDASGNYLNTTHKNGACLACTTWQPLANMPTPRAFATATALPDGTIMVIGGEDANGPVGAIERYDPASNTWTTMTSLPGGLTRSKSILVNGILHVIGGYGDPFGQPTDEILNLHLAYDPASQQWSLLSNLPIPLMDHALIYKRNGLADEIWVMGGRYPNGQSSTVSNGIIVWQESTQSFVPTPVVMPSPRAGFGAASTSPVDQDVFVFGGYTDNAGTIDPSMDRYHPQFTNQWMVWDPNYLPLAEFWSQGYWDAATQNCVFYNRVAGGVDPLGNYSPLTYRNVLLTGGLPIESLEFTATPKNEGVHLQWSADRSNEISHFTLSHSADGLNYTTLQERNPADGLSQWQYVDVTHRPDGRHYYQLEAYDWNGNQMDSRTTSVLFSNEGELVVSIFPNPATDEINLTFAEQGQDRMVKLIRMNGSVVMDQRVSSSGTSKLDIRGLSTGLYILEITANDQTFRPRILVQKD